LNGIGLYEFHAALTDSDFDTFESSLIQPSVELIDQFRAC
jgi:hypothetical protein